MYVYKQDKRTKRRESRRLQKGNIYHTKEGTTQGKLPLTREEEGGAILRGITWINKGNTVIPGKAVKKVRLYQPFSGAKSIITPEWQEKKCNINFTIILN